MADLVSFVFSGAALATLTLVFGFWITARPASRAARRSLLLAGVLYCAASMHVFSYPFEQLLLLGYRPLTRADVPAGRTAIIVLGSGGFTARDWGGGQYTVVGSAAAERVREAARVFQLIDADWVIASGGREDPGDPDTSSALAVRQSLIDEGVPVARVLILSDVRNTFEEATALDPLLKRLGAEHAVLVTSSTHMRRAMGTFRAVGVAVIPAIARGSSLNLSWPNWLLPTDGGLTDTRAVVHEYLGIVEYFARGRFKF